MVSNILAITNPIHFGWALPTIGTLDSYFNYE
jgi:hypothetical protein